MPPVNALLGPRSRRAGVSYRLHGDHGRSHEPLGCTGCSVGSRVAHPRQPFQLPRPVCAGGPGREPAALGAACLGHPVGTADVRLHRRLHADLAPLRLPRRPRAAAAHRRRRDRGLEPRHRPRRLGAQLCRVADGPLGGRGRRGRLCHHLPGHARRLLSSLRAGAGVRRVQRRHADRRRRRLHPGRAGQRPLRLAGGVLRRRLPGAAAGTAHVAAARSAARRHGSRPERGAGRGAGGRAGGGRGGGGGDGRAGCRGVIGG